MIIKNIKERLILTIVVQSDYNQSNIDHSFYEFFFPLELIVNTSSKLSHFKI